MRSCLSRSRWRASSYRSSRNTLDRHQSGRDEIRGTVPTTSYGVLRPVGAPDDAAAARFHITADFDFPGPTRLWGCRSSCRSRILFLGTTRLLSESGGLAVARPLVAFGIVLSLVGIGQYTLTLHEMHPLIYGFWKPQSEAARPFGPFVNPNHFAGWMLMVLPLGLALFCEAFERMLRTAAARMDNVASVVGLPEFGQVLTFGFAWVVMGLSLIMTRSRSALAALAAGGAIALWIVLRRQRSFHARLAVVAAFLIVLGGAGAWAGLDTLLGKALSGDHTNDSFGGRLRAWRDTRRIIEDFPLTGSGFNTYGTAMTIYQTGQRDVHFQEAHNEYLQLAAEGGLLIGIPILATLAIFARQIRRRFVEAPKEGTTYWLRVGAVIGLLSIGLQSLLDFSLQMPGNAALFAVLAAIAVHQSPNLRRRTPSRVPNAPHAGRRLTAV